MKLSKPEFKQLLREAFSEYFSDWYNVFRSTFILDGDQCVEDNQVVKKCLSQSELDYFLNNLLDAVDDYKDAENIKVEKLKDSSIKVSYTLNDEEYYDIYNVVKAEPIKSLFTKHPLNSIYMQALYDLDLLQAFDGYRWISYTDIETGYPFAIISQHDLKKFLDNLYSRYGNALDENNEQCLSEIKDWIWQRQFFSPRGE